MRVHVYSSIWTVISEVNPGQKKLENVWGFFFSYFICYTYNKTKHFLTLAFFYICLRVQGE